MPGTTGCDTPETEGCGGEAIWPGSDAKLPTTGLDAVVWPVTDGETEAESDDVPVDTTDDGAVSEDVSVVVALGSVTTASEVVALALASPPPRTKQKQHT